MKFLSEILKKNSLQFINFVYSTKEEIAMEKSTTKVAIN